MLQLVDKGKRVVRLAWFRADCSNLERLVKPILAEAFLHSDLHGGGVASKAVRIS